MALAALLVALLTSVFTAQAPQTPAAYTVLSREGRRPLAVRVISGQEMFAVDELARLFGLALREDTIAGGLTITVRNQSIILSPNQELVSVAGRLISLPAAPVRDGRAWFVPLDFVSRALAPVVGTRLELRKPSRLVIVGDVRVPRIAGRVEPQGALARVTFDVAPPTPTPWRRKGAGCCFASKRTRSTRRCRSPPLQNWSKAFASRAPPLSRSISVYALRRSRAPIFPATAAARASSST